MASAMIRSFMYRNMVVTTASMSSETKNAISHRGKALQLIKPVIGAYLDTKGI